jgi:hypothetical protein
VEDSSLGFLEDSNIAALKREAVSGVEGFQIIPYGKEPINNEAIRNKFPS